MSNERADLIATLRYDECDEGCKQPCKLSQQTRDKAADLLERDGARITELEAERGETRKENEWLRAYTGQSAKACVYCGLGADEQAQCERGFPGCARGDDQMLCPEVGVAIERDEARAEAEALRKEAARYRWLRDVFFSGRSAFALVGPIRTPEELAAAIDAAIAKE